MSSGTQIDMAYCSRGVIRALMACSRPAQLAYWATAWNAPRESVRSSRRQVSVGLVVQWVEQEFGVRLGITRAQRAIGELVKARLVIADWTSKGGRQELTHVEVLTSLSASAA